MNQLHRRKTSRHNLWRPEDLGLVPQKYLKRWGSVTETSYSSSDSVPPSTPPAGHRIMDSLDVITPTPSVVVSTDDQQNNHHESSSSTDPGKALLELNHLLMKRGPRMPKSDFVEDWKTTMLRAENFNVEKAAIRCSHHWNVKSNLFGTPDLKTVVRDLAPNLVEKGSIQVVPIRDSRDRAIICIHFQPKLYSSHEREVRIHMCVVCWCACPCVWWCVWLSNSLYSSYSRSISIFIITKLKKYLFYMLASVLEDIETQQAGISLVVWNTQDLEAATNNSFVLLSPTKFGGGIFDPFWSLWRSIRQAFKIDRLHYCTLDLNNNSTMTTMIHSPSSTSNSIVQESQDSETVIRQYSASPHECLHAMLTFGIPVHALPILANETNAPFDNTWHLRWVDWRQKTDSYVHVPSLPEDVRNTNTSKQQHGQPTRIILLPSSNDILLGGYGDSGRVPLGNVKFHQLLCEFLENYIGPNVTTASRVSICMEIYHRMCPSRFLQPLDPIYGVLWEMISQDLVIDRIHSAMKYLMARQKEEEDGDPNNNNSTSPTWRRFNASTDLEWVEWLPDCCTIGQPSFCNWKNESPPPRTIRRDLQ